MRLIRSLAALFLSLATSASLPPGPLPDALSGVVRGPAGETIRPDPDGRAVGGRGIADRFIAEAPDTTRRFTIFEDSVAPNADNRLVMPHGITPSQVGVSAGPDGDLLLRTGNMHVVVRHQFLQVSGHRLGIQGVDFDQGKWNQADLVRLAQPGAAPSRSRDIASLGGSTIGRAGLFAVHGSGDRDIFKIDKTATYAAIFEASAARDPHNELVLGPGLSARDAEIWSYETEDYRLSFPSGPTIMLEGMAHGGNGITYGVQAIRFADGTIWTPQSIIARLNALALKGEFGELSDDTAGHVLDSHGKPDLSQIKAFGGGDTIIFRRGYGNLRVTEEDLSERPDNVLAFGPDISLSDLTLMGEASGDLMLAIGQESVTLVHALANRPGRTFGVQRVRFANGTELNYAELLARASSAATGDRDLVGDARPNVVRLDGRNRSVVGRGGGDTFLYDRGAGFVELSEEESSEPHPANRLVLSKGIIPASVIVLRDTDDGVYLELGRGDGILLARESRATASGDFGVQFVQFTDGTRWSRADLLHMAAGNSLDRAAFVAKREESDARRAKDREARIARFADMQVSAIFTRFLADLYAGLDRIGLPAEEADALLPLPILRRDPSRGCRPEQRLAAWRDVANVPTRQHQLRDLADTLDLKYGTSDVDTAMDYMGTQQDPTALNAMGMAVDALRSGPTTDPLLVSCPQGSVIQRLKAGILAH